jgi:5-oxoprolinase (ATP-hydrolysing) subunit A
VSTNGAERVVDVNCDCGEIASQIAAGVDDALVACVSSVSLACGGHAGDDTSMRRLVRVAMRAGTRIGAHPSYPDVANFGRVSVPMAMERLQASVAEQVARLADICRELGATLAYVKPHGALYHDCAREGVARAVASAVTDVMGRDALMFAGSDEAAQTWSSMGLRVVREAFADRAYEANGALRSRSTAGAVLDARLAAEQAVILAREGAVWGGERRDVRVVVACDTMCVHGDGPDAIATARAVVGALRACGVSVHAREA